MTSEPDPCKPVAWLLRRDKDGSYRARAYARQDAADAGARNFTTASGQTHTAVPLADLTQARDEIAALRAAVIDQIGWLDTMLSGARFTNPGAGRATILLKSAERRLSILRAALTKKGAG